MNGFELCKDICNLHSSILGAGIIEKASLVAIYSRPGSPIPTKEKFDHLFFQTEVIASIMNKNADFFGAPKTFSLYYENADVYFFHLFRYGGKRGVLAVLITSPYDHEDLIERISACLEQNL